MAGYFTYLPNIYVANGVKEDEAINYTLVKNIFRRLAVDEDLNQNFVQFERARVEEGDTPSSIALDYYGDPYMDWVILITNNIINYAEEWPKDSYDFLQFVLSKYKGDTGGVHHWETKEIKYEGDILIPQGIQVNESYRASLPDGTILSKNSSITSITNYDHEEYLNEQKRFIRLPTPTTVALMKDELEDGLTYNNCPELDEEGNKKTELSIVSRFLTTNDSVTRPQGNTSETLLVTSYDTDTSFSTAGISTSGETTPTTTTTTITTPNPAPASTPTPSPTPSPSPSPGGGGY